VDLHEMKDLDAAGAEAFITALHEPARKLLTMAIPAIAAIRGPCLGGALELVLACDIRIAAEDAVLGLPEVRVGIPSVIEASLLPPTIGLGRARRLLLTGETVDAAAALSMGLVDRVVPADSLMREAHETASRFLGMSRDVLASQKKSSRNGWSWEKRRPPTSPSRNSPASSLRPSPMRGCRLSWRNTRRSSGGCRDHRLFYAGRDRLTPV
jgi:enoyl-CoA hydratase/carnithine racemase